MKKLLVPAALGASLALGLGACTNPYDPGQRAVGGGLIGAGAGAAIGALGTPPPKGRSAARNSAADDGRRSRSRSSACSTTESSASGRSGLRALGGGGGSRLTSS